MQILDADNNKVAEDAAFDRDAVVNFQPALSGRYTVRLRLYESANNLPCAVVGMLLERGAKGRVGDGYGRYVADAALRVGKLIDKASEARYKFGEPALALGGGWLEQDRNRWVALSTVPLTAGKHYRFLAGGDDDAEEVALQIVDPQNASKEYASNKGAAQNGSIDFEPKTTGNYLIRLCLYGSRDNVPCFCIAVVMSK